MYGSIKTELVTLGKMSVVYAEDKVVVGDSQLLKWLKQIWNIIWIALKHNVTYDKLCGKKNISLPG